MRVRSANSTMRHASARTARTRKPALAGEEYRVATISGKRGMEDAYRLRYRVFCQELGWVKGGADGIETDSYDIGAVHFGVYNRAGVLAGYLRLILSPGKFMVEDEFRPLLGPGRRVRKERDTAEISRLCILPEARVFPANCATGLCNVSQTLFRGVYHWCMAGGVRFLYAVADEKNHSHLAVLRLALFSEWTVAASG